MPEQAMHAISFAGDFFVRDRSVSGSQFFKLGDVQQLEFGIETNVKEAKSKGLATYGQTIDSVTTIDATSLTCGFNALSKSGMNLAFGGTSKAWTQTAADATTQALVVKLDQWIPLNHRRVSDVSIPTFTLGTHYTVDLEQGMVMFHSGVAGAAVADASHTITYDAAAITGGEKVALLNNATKSLEIRFNGKDLTTGEFVEIVIPHAKMSPSSGFDLMADDFPTVELNASLVLDTAHAAYDVNNPSSVYMYRRPAAA